MSTLLKSFYHNLKEPIFICDTQSDTFYQNKACVDVFGEISPKMGIKALKKIDYKFHFDYCTYKSDDINFSPFDEIISSKGLCTAYGVYQESEFGFKYFVIKAFSIKKYRILYFYDSTKEIECEKITDENEKLKLENQKFINTNSKAQNQAVKMALLNRISTSLSKTLDIKTLISVALKELSIILGATKLFFGKRINENEFNIEYKFPNGIKSEDKVFYFEDKSIKILTEGKIVQSTSLKEHDKSKNTFKTPYTRVILPVLKQNDIVGVIICFSPVRKLPEAEIELLISVSKQISNAFFEASLFNEISKQKGELQNALNELKETQLQLINSEKMASLGQLIASVAHEINTPLASISSNNEILRKLLIEKIPDELRETFVDINDIDKEAIKRINNLVQSLKRFVRLDETVVQKANINKELDLTLDILRHKTKKGIEIIKNYGEINEILCYPNMLNQVFLNLLMNAIQSIEKQKTIKGENYRGKIEILTKEENNNLIIKITDNGMGISDINKKKIFQAGFTTKKVGEGTGLGLAICKKIIEKHKGKISFDSKISKTLENVTYFTIAIPAQIEI